MNKYKIRDIILILLIIIGLFLYYNKPNNTNKKLINKDFSIHFIDIGEGDSMIISSNNEYILIDTGKYEYKDKLLKYINNLGIKEFKYVIGTHAHEDHIGTMPTIIRNYKVDRFLMPSCEVNNTSYTLTRKELDKRNISYEIPSINDEYTLNDTKLKVISISDKCDELNDTSIVLKVTYKSNSFLLTGDATKNVELNILDKDIKSDLLKVSHHGSNHSSSAQFLNKVKPVYAIISTGENNDYHHPHNITLQKLDKINTKVYRTDLNGNIIAYSDGNNIKIEKEKD